MTTEQTTPAPEPVNEKALEGWKEIAAYLNRGVRTVKRWEKSEGLPVSRHVHQARASVYAYPSELDAWRTQRRPVDERAVDGFLWRWPARAISMAVMLIVALLTAGGGLINPPSSAAQGKSMVVRQVWTGAGVDPTGSPSRDGRYLSFVDWSTGDIALYDFAGHQTRQLSHKGSWFDSGEFALHSSISPDGKLVAFSWYAKDPDSGWNWQLRVVGTDGSNPRVLHRNPELGFLRPFEWSPDGKQILTILSRGDQTNQIALVSVADGSVAVLRTLDWRFPGGMSFSPDGRYIAYDFAPTEKAKNNDIFLLAADGSREVRLVEHPAHDTVLGWAPDGGALLIASNRTGTVDAWLMRVREGQAEGTPELVRKNLGKVLPLGFTSNGSYYFAMLTGMLDVYLAQLDPTTGRVLDSPKQVNPELVGASMSPAWSPDGNRLAFVAGRQVQPGGGQIGRGTLTILTAATRERRELTPTLSGFHEPRWSPDGRSILVWGYDTKWRPGLFRIDVETSETERLLEKDGIYNPVWAKDGRSVYYRGRRVKGEQTRVFELDLATREEKELYRGSAKGLVLSPDGKDLAFRQADGEFSCLRIIPVSGGSMRELFRLRQAEISAQAWSADGRYVLYVAQSKKGNQLWRIPAEGGEPQSLGLVMKGLRELAVHPNGRQIAFTAGKPEAEIWVMENFLPTLKAAK